MKNMSATSLFSAGAILPSFESVIVQKDGETKEDFEARDKEARQAMTLASNMSAGEEKDEAVSALAKSLLPELANALVSLGVRLPSDRLEMTVTLGSFLFDLYLKSAKTPTGAPLAQAIYQKRVQDFASRLNSEEFELSKEEASVIQKTLQEEAVWDTFAFSGYVTVNDEKRYLSLNSKAAPYFASVLNSAVTMIMSYDRVG